MRCITALKRIADSKKKCTLKQLNCVCYTEQAQINITSISKLELFDEVIDLFPRKISSFPGSVSATKLKLHSRVPDRGGIPASRGWGGGGGGWGRGVSFNFMVD